MLALSDDVAGPIDVEGTGAGARLPADDYEIDAIQQRRINWPSHAAALSAVTTRSGTVGKYGFRILKVARQEPGEARDALRDEVARQWITKDRDAAIEWMNALEQADRRASATIAMRTLAAIEPAQAIAVADQFGVGHDDGSLEHMVQIWATEKPDEGCDGLKGNRPANRAPLSYGHASSMRARDERSSCAAPTKALLLAIRSPW